MILKKVFKATDSISKKIEIPIPSIIPTIIDDIQDQIDDITDNLENEYYVNYVFDKYDYFISTKPFYFHFEIPLGTVEIASAKVSFEIKDYRNSSLTDSRYAITGDSEARPIITFYVSEDRGCKFGNAYGPYETDMRAIDISGDLTGEGIKVIKFTTDNDVCISARIFLKLKVTKIGSLERPEIRTLSATSIIFNSAILNGDIIKTGSGYWINRSTGETGPINTCTKRGFKWATTKADTNNESETGSFVKGKYGLSITGLTAETDYYFRAYADNPLKVFGEYLKFTTKPIIIDAGSPAIDRSFSGGSGKTSILGENPATVSGTIIRVEIWANTNLTDVSVATFTEVSTNRFTARSNHYIGNVTSGTKQTFEVNLNVEIGDHIGIYIPVFTTIEMSLSGYEGYWEQIGDQTECNDIQFAFNKDRTYSFRGIG